MGKKFITRKNRELVDLVKRKIAGSGGCELETRRENETRNVGPTLPEWLLTDSRLRVIKQESG